jgi:glycosyltransferase involved in cell wall biosynthesis
VSDDVWGGAEAVIRGLLQAQIRQPGVVPLLVALNHGALASFAREQGIAVEVIPETGRSFLTLLRATDATIARLRPHVIHSHRYKENFIAWLVGPRHGARSVVTLHGEEPVATRTGRLKVWLRRAVSRCLAVRAGARFVTVSPDLPALLGLAASQWVSIPNGIPLPAPARSSASPRPSGEAGMVGWVGRLVPVKDLPLLLAAIALLPASLRGTRLLLVGEGPERAALAAEAARLGIADRVEFRGFVRDPGPERARMDVFALPSVYEGAPIALLEAMGAGLPCVAAAVGGVPLLVGASDTAHLLTSRRPEDWASALAALLSRPDDARSLGERARARIAEHFTIDAVAEAYLGVYREAAAGSLAG